MKCSEIRKHAGEYVDRTLAPELVGPFESHLDACKECARTVRELEAASSLVRSLSREGAPLGFEQRLRERIVMQQAETPSVRKVGPFEALRSFFAGDPILGRRPGFRPALVGAALAVVAGIVIYSGQWQQPTATATDWAYINTCREQHESFASANPLADESALILQRRTQELGGEL